MHINNNKIKKRKTDNELNGFRAKGYELLVMTFCPSSGLGGM